MNITAIITAAGKGSRAELDKNKVLALMPDGKTVLEHSVAPFDADERITELIVTAAESDKENIAAIAAKFSTPCKIVGGGATRTLSVVNALEAASGDITLIHDAARPFVSADVIDGCINGVIKYGSAVASVPLSDTVAEINEDGDIVGAMRDGLCRVQTPQGFFTDELRRAYSMIEQGELFTDDSGVYCRYIRPAHTCPGSIKNAKLTYREDFNRLSDVRVGTGFDLHRLVEGRKLVLGGAEIPHDKGLLGHSDADVLVHAVMDALLSAAALRDIGYHFSDKDARYKDISSMILLSRVLAMLKTAGYRPKNLSAVIMAEKPKLSPYVPAMTENLANALGIDKSLVGITCTTLEGVGSVGREEAIAANAYCSIERIL